MNTLSTTSIIVRNTEIVTANMDGETVMMSIENGKYYNLGKVGSAIWERIEEPISIEMLIEKLLEQYAVGREQCLTEVMKFLSDTAKEGLVKLTD